MCGTLFRNTKISLGSALTMNNNEFVTIIKINPSYTTIRSVHSNSERVMPNIESQRTV